MRPRATAPAAESAAALPSLSRSLTPSREASAALLWAGTHRARTRPLFRCGDACCQRSACSNSLTSAPAAILALVLTTYSLSDTKSMGAPISLVAATKAVTSARWAVCLPPTGPPQLQFSRSAHRRPQAALARRGSVGCRHPPSVHMVHLGACMSTSAGGGSCGSSPAAASASAASRADSGNVPVRATPGCNCRRKTATSRGRGASGGMSASA